MVLRATALFTYHQSRFTGHPLGLTIMIQFGRILIVLLALVSPNLLRAEETDDARKKTPNSPRLTAGSLSATQATNRKTKSKPTTSSTRRRAKS